MKKFLITLGIFLLSYVSFSQKNQEKCMKGDILMKSDVMCAGKLEFSFDSEEKGAYYEYKIFGINEQVVYEASGLESSYIYPIIHQTGIFTIVITVRYSDGTTCTFRKQFTLENCGDQCILGYIKSDSSTCLTERSVFWFVADSSTPIDHTDPSLQFEWSVTDTYGNFIVYEPVYLFNNNFAYSIIVPNDGPYTVSLRIITEKCKSDLFYTEVSNKKDCECRIFKGEIKTKEEKFCAGNKILFYFDGYEAGYSYSWNILNSNYENIYSSSGHYPDISTTVNHPGDYVIILTVKNKEGCEQQFIFSFSIADCGDRCLLGEIKNNDILCLGAYNFFWFVPDPSTPIDYSDPSLQFYWNVTDEYGNSQAFNPINLFGSPFPYYITVPFDYSGNFTVSLVVKTLKCKATFEKDIRLEKECNCIPGRGGIETDQVQMCTGENLVFYFNSPLPGSTYSWNILNAQYESVYSYTGPSESLTSIVNVPGEYTLLLTVKGANGCEALRIHRFTVEDCDSGGGQEECYYHLAFSYALPNSTQQAINNEVRLNIATGISIFVNQNVTGKMLITSVDDFFNGSRFSAKQALINEYWTSSYVTPSDEIYGVNSIGNNLMLRIQDHDYPNTVANSFDLLAGENSVSMPVDVNFVIVSKDSNTSEIAASYTNMISSGKVKKVYFILLSNGDYKVNGQVLSHSSFINQILGRQSVNFTETNSIYNSDYVIFPASLIQNQTIGSSIQSFVQSGFNEIKKNKICNASCFAGEIQSNTTLCAGTDNSFWFAPTGAFNYTDPTLQFHWSVTRNGVPVVYNTVGTNNTAIDFNSPVAGDYTIVLVINNSSCTKTIAKTFRIGKCTVASCGDSTNQYYVVQLFKELLQHLKGQASVADGYSCPQLIALAPYINPSISGLGIYDFSNTGTSIQFSFAASVSSPHVIFNMANPGSFVGLSLGNNFIDMNYQTSFISTFFQFSTIFPNVIPVSGSHVSQINFCPANLACISHIAIVLDESTSINSVDAGRIRGQLKKFIEQQVEFNQTMGSQTKISLIGLSDQDNDIRTDHVLNLLANPANKQTFVNWINKYKVRYNLGLAGVSSNSDYWNSGLFKAAQTDASLVILMTDGAQTNSVAALKNTLSLFNNANSSAQKHLYVIGLNDGYYVDSPAGSSIYSADSNPNLVIQSDAGEEYEDVTVSNSLNSTSETSLTNFLRISLRALIYNNTQFPSESVYDFTKDYSGHTNFKLLYDDPSYLSNGIYKFLGETCGAEQYLKRCDDCDGVQLDLKQSYIISAWVHVDKTQQVVSFKEANQSPSIEIHFCIEGDIEADNENPDNPNSQHLSGVDQDGVFYEGAVEFFPQGNIIDGWQRIFGVFKVHPSTEYMKIILNNGSRSDAMHFDDIRIHPRDGSMKSFIYDEQNYKLMSELDENNYSTYYEYDAEGGLVRVKKETERGIKTIQETRSGSIIKSE